MEFLFPLKLKLLIDLSCQRNMLFTFDGKCYGPSLDIEKAFVAFVRGHSDEAGFETVQHVTLSLEHTWDGHAVDMIDAGTKKAAELAKQF